MNSLQLKHRYSTCSLNPIENTAVVAELIRNAKGSVEILDVSKILPKIKYEAGHQTWKVMVSKGDRIFEHWKDVPEDDANLQNRLTKSMFPPSPEEAKKLGLERSMRLLSHQNNTGSFYCCLLRKTRALPKSFHLSVPKIALKDQVREEFENVDSSEPVKKRAKIEESKVEESSSNTTSSTTNTSTNTYFQIQDSFFEFIQGDVRNEDT